MKCGLKLKGKSQKLRKEISHTDAFTELRSEMRNRAVSSLSFVHATLQYAVKEKEKKVFGQQEALKSLRTL